MVTNITHIFKQISVRKSLNNNDWYTLVSSSYSIAKRHQKRLIQTIRKVNLVDKLDNQPNAVGHNRLLSLPYFPHTLTVAARNGPTRIPNNHNQQLFREGTTGIGSNNSRCGTAFMQVTPSSFVQLLIPKILN